MTAKRISVLVTGGSTGIGRSIAEDLARGGHQVFASVRKREDGEVLRPSGVIPVQFDVTDEAAVQRAVEEISRLRDASLAFSIVNNAGIAVPGPLEDLSIDDLKRQFEVNVFGVMRVTKAFLPFVRGTASGRIVNMSSVSGLFAMPFLGAYSSSKFALEALSDSLRRELAHEGIKVLLIEPGSIKTPIWDKNLGGPKMKVSTRYEKASAKLEAFVKDLVAKALEPEHVTRAVKTALLANDPPVRQVVADLPRTLEVWVAKAIPTKWIDASVVRRLFG